MRAIALLLIIVNLGYLGWATLIDVREVPVARIASDTNVQPLVLASERAKITVAAAARSQKQRAERSAANNGADTSREAIHAALPAATANHANQTGPQCISIGPFQDLTSAAQASATLKSASHESRQRLEQGQLWVGYWVNAPGFAKREDAERAIVQLKQNGITDVSISLSGADVEASNVVSLGVFKEAERAQRVLLAAKSLGFAAQITDRTRTGSVYWIDVDVPSPQPNFDFSTLGAQPGKILRLEQRACPTTSR